MHTTHINKFSARVQGSTAEDCVSAIKSADYALSAVAAVNLSEEQKDAARKNIVAMKLPDNVTRSMLASLEPDTNKLDVARVETLEAHNKVVASIRRHILPATLKPEDVAKMDPDTLRIKLQGATELWNRFGKVVPSKTQNN